jgi:anti-sigma-K factor RskA
VDIKAYIESGILELFVLGQTTPEESAEVLRMAAAYPEIKEELNQIESALISYAETFQTPAPEHIKEKIFANLDEEDSFVVSEPISENRPDTNLEMPRKSSGMFNSYFSIAASLVLLAMSIFVNVWLYSKWKNSEQELVTLAQNQQSLVDRLNVSDTKYNVLAYQMKEQIEVMKNPEVKQVVLKGLPLMPSALATIYWNPKTEEVFINANSLPSISDANALQLWAIVDGKPVDLGLVPVQTSLESLVKMKNVQNASAFAITIEGKGGSVSPTMDKMIVLGTSS